MALAVGLGAYRGERRNPGRSDWLDSGQSAVNLLLYGFVALAILGTVAGIGYKVRQGGYDACKVDWEASDAQARKREQDASTKAAAELAAEREKKKVVIQTRTAYVDREVEKPVYRNVCLPDSGLSCLNAAIAGKDATGCKPDAAVPGAKPTK